MKGFYLSRFYEPIPGRNSDCYFYIWFSEQVKVLQKPFTWFNVWTTYKQDQTNRSAWWQPAAASLKVAFVGISHHGSHPFPSTLQKRYEWKWIGSHSNIAPDWSLNVNPRLGLDLELAKHCFVFTWYKYDLCLALPQVSWKLNLWRNFKLPWYPKLLFFHLLKVN